MLKLMQIEFEISTWFRAFEGHPTYWAEEQWKPPCLRNGLENELSIVDNKVQINEMFTEGISSFA